MSSAASFRRVATPFLAALAGVAALCPLRAQDERARDQRRLDAVIAYANTVLKDAADHYHAPATPLLANGVNVFTKDPLTWTFPDGRQAVMADFVEQQNLMRVLAALTNMTGDPAYKAAAKAQYAYYFGHYQDKCGLLQWGGHRFVDLKSLEVMGFSGIPVGDSPHELKNAYPYYELMYEVNPEATKRFIRGFWNAHVYNWRTLEISRHGDYTHDPAAHWDQPFDDPAPFFFTKGLSFLDAGNDLIYSGAMLYKLTGDQGALVWTRRLAQQFVKARNPETKLGAYQYTQSRKTKEPTADSQTESWYGDRAKRQFGPDFPGHLVLEGTMLLKRLAQTIYSDNALMELQLGQDLGPDGREMLESTREGLVAFIHHAQVPGSTLFRPMLTDGTDLSNFVVKRDGYYDRKGSVLKPYRATPELMIAFARGFLVTGDPTLWKMARDIAADCGLGELGSTPGQGMKVNLQTKNADAFALFSILDLYRHTREPGYLALARVLGDNIVAQKFHHGYFTPYPDTIYANVNSIEPYALLALEAAIKGVPEKVPTFINGFGFYSGAYKFADGRSKRINDDLLYRPRQSAPDLPFERQSTNTE